MSEWNFASCWEALADAQPEKLALAQGDRHRTWAEWDERSAPNAGAVPSHQHHHPQPPAIAGGTQRESHGDPEP